MDSKSNQEDGLADRGVGQRKATPNLIEGASGFTEPPYV